MKLCIDCKHYQHGKPSECGHKRNLHVSLVTGRVNFISSPFLQRAHIWPIAVVLGECGHSGRWFEPRRGGAA